LTIVTIFNSPSTQKNRLQLVLNPAARAGTVTIIPKFHHNTPILNTFSTGSRLVRESNKRFSLTFIRHINLSKLVNLLTSALFHCLHVVVLGLLSYEP